MSTTMTIRPIDEELTRLHQPVITTAEDDIDSALDGFRVTNSGSVMVPSGFTKPLMVQRNLSTVSNASSSYSSGSNQAAADPYYQAYHQGVIHGSLPRYSTSVPAQVPPSLPPSLPTSLPRSLPRTLPKSVPNYYAYPHNTHNMAGSPMTMVGSPMTMAGSPLTVTGSSAVGYHSMSYPYPHPQYYPSYGY